MKRIQIEFLLDLCFSSSTNDQQVSNVHCHLSAFKSSAFEGCTKEEESEMQSILDLMGSTDWQDKMKSLNTGGGWVKTYPKY